MTEPAAPTPLSDRVLQRLRKLAPGNGLEPAAIEIVEKQEQVFSFEGLMEATPFAEARPSTYAGAVQRREARMMPDSAGLTQIAAQHQKQFREQPNWLGEIADELKKQVGEGWGLDGAKVVLPDRSALFAATEICPTCQGRKVITCEQCQGRGTVICPQCQGQGKEQCYHCLGHGEDPQVPGQRCPICHGTRYAPCRFCQTHGYLPCPTCQGRRGTTCVACQGQGSLTQEVEVTCGAEMHFKLTTHDLPSGFRRGMDRIGIANLSTGGHADIVAKPPTVDPDAPPRDKPPYPVMAYEAKLPYAELRMLFGNAKRRTVVSAFGKRCYIMGVPPFLDESLKPWRAKLRAAATGAGELAPALEARAFREMMDLIVAGKTRPEEARRLYPYGFAPDSLKAICGDLRLALNRVTLKIRTAMAVVSALLGGGVFYALFDLGRGHLETMAPGMGIAFALTVLLVTLGAAWAGLNFSVRWALKRRFPHAPIALQQKIGKTGWSMLAALVALFALALALMPVRPWWL